MRIIKTILAGNAPVSLTSTVNAQRHGIIIKQAGSSWPKWVRELFATFRKANWQIVAERWHFIIRKIIFSNKHENHSRHFFHRIGSQSGGTNDFVIGVANNRIEIAAFQVEGKSVIPT